MNQLPEVIAALTADASAVDEMVADLDPESWRLPTPAPGWTIADQIAHLSFVFRIAGMAAARPDQFTAMTARLEGGFDSVVNGALADYVKDAPPVLLARWRAERDAGIRSLSAVPDGQVVPWLVNPLPPAVLGCAGMMELFGHGQDIADTLGIERRYTDRLAYLVGFGVRTWEFGYQSRKQQPPDVLFRFELTAPSGALWTFGPDGSDQRIEGPAVDFCLLVTRRRHRADLALTATGPDADRWLDIAQAYRGPAGAGRRIGQFATVH